MLVGGGVEYMIWVIGLILLAAVLISFEIIIPGAVLGFLGLLVFFSACVVAAVQFGPVHGVFTFLIGGIFLGVLLFLEFKWLPRTSMGKQLFLSKSVRGKANEGLSGDLIGKTGEALTPLRPSGMVLLDGIQYEATSKDGFIQTGERLKVVGKDNFRVVVIRI